VLLTLVAKKCNVFISSKPVNAFAKMLKIRRDKNVLMKGRCQNIHFYNWDMDALMKGRCIHFYIWDMDALRKLIHNKK